jgi:hypothetical protein
LHNVLKVLVALVFVVAAAVVGFDFKNNLQTTKNIASQRSVLLKDLAFWESFISKQNNFPNAYFQASVLEYRLGDISKAKVDVEKGLILDPNSVDGRKIEEFLKNKFYF